jgi:hypothetical protein
VAAIREGRPPEPFIDDADPGLADCLHCDMVGAGIQMPTGDDIWLRCRKGASEFEPLYTALRIDHHRLESAHEWLRVACSRLSKHGWERPAEDHLLPSRGCRFTTRECSPGD